jgi:hypothetical protein
LEAEAVFHSSLAIRWSELRSFDWPMALVSKAELLSSIAKVGPLDIRCPLKRDQLDVPSLFRRFVVRPTQRPALMPTHSIAK